MKASARIADPLTSHIAAESVEASGRAGTQRDRILAYVKAHPNQTAGEIAQGMNTDQYTPSRRLPELERAGLVRVSGRRACRVKGSLMQTWDATEIKETLF